VRLLHARNDLIGSGADQKARGSHRPANQNRNGGQSVPLRGLQTDHERGASRGRGNGEKLNAIAGAADLCKANHIVVMLS